eukprot:TRINITY_DN18852_c0_g1_i1.p1 TRINITY_DN18852_c0_g1~~TRINITY_DN18852_c0_g1_i1.p1  ORF type:complete len:106 (-),score=14.62 TRINITY_DN18852_c0_g1_i1:34-351(-)
MTSKSKKASKGANEHPLEDRKLKLTVTPFVEGGELNMLVVVQDITEGERLIRLEEKDKYKSFLMNTISHELRTPLNTIITMLDRLNSCVDAVSYTHLTLPTIYSV